MAKIKNTSFFKKSVEAPVAGEVAPKQTQTQTAEAATPVEASTIEDQPVTRVVKLPQKLMQNVSDTAKALNAVGFPGLAREVAGLQRKVIDEHFTFAVVGEFNRGKSTLINRLLRCDSLPVATLPTTALLTRITYGRESKMKVYDKDGKLVKELPFTADSWKGLTADNFGGREPEGHVVVETPDQWLARYGIDLIDTPGAGDLEERRARVIERCLVSTDAALIAIDATRVLSLTEKEFIKQKVLSRGIPFVALAITKLDLVAAEEREKVIGYVFKQLELIKVKIPVIIPDDTVEVPGGKYDSIIGIDKLKALVVAWLGNPARRELTIKWLETNVKAILNSAAAMLAGQKEIFDADEVKRERLIADRNAELAKVHDRWEELRNGMRARCQKCITEFNAKAAKYGDAIVETLQHEVMRVPVPKDWLDNEYSYRVKRELSAVSLSLDNFVAKQVATDLHWLNGEMSKQFKEIVRIETQELAADQDFRPDVDSSAGKLENLKDQSTKATLVTSALTLGAALMLGASGAAPIILATMGVGTGANLISRKLLEKKSEKQREELKKLIAAQMPQIISEASADSAVKIRIIYNDIISEAFSTESRWMQTQRTLIRQAVTVSSNIEAAEKVKQQIAAIEDLRKLFK